MLAVSNLSVAYDEAVAVRDVSLAVSASRVVAVLGANGAGKSTLVNAIAGLVPSLAGHVTLDGLRLDGQSAERRVAAGVSLVPEGRALFPSLSVRDNLSLGAFRRRGRRSLDDVLTVLPALRDKLKQEAGTLSGGEQQMLAIGRALMSGPKLLILDEPSLGLSPQMVTRIFGVVRDMAEAGVGILLVEQNARAALDLADYGVILERGRVAAEGPSAELRDDATVVKAYLGVAV